MNHPRPWIEHPTYAAAFRCIGPACEDHCCGGWDIPLDPATANRYQHLQPPDLATLALQFVHINPPPQPSGHFAAIRQTASGLCPFFAPDHLCRLQSAYGPDILSASCSIYPRSLSLVGSRLEGSLSLSCPEAARNVLLQPHFMEQAAELHSGAFRTDNVYRLDGASPTNADHFLAIRQAMVQLVLDRRWPLWQRLLHLGSLCEQLEALGTKTDHAAMLSIVQAFPEDQPPRAFDDLVPNPRLLLDVVFELTDVLMQDGSSPRFQETFFAFIAGLSAGPDLPKGSDTDRFLHARESTFRAYFEASPHILENLLVNTMLQTLFPCGRAGAERFDPQTLLGEYLQLVTRFLWLEALLVGVAGSHGDRFADEHVVKTVQSFARAVEHYPSVLIWMREVLQQKGLHNLPGMTLLLAR
jgi:lysine-N-methylase